MQERRKLTPPSLETLDRAGFVVVDDVIRQDRLVALRTVAAYVVVPETGSQRIFDATWRFAIHQAGAQSGVA